MSYLKLMKLMYLAEKECLLRYGEFLTGDRTLSMPHGPVLSSVYTMFCDGGEYWNNWIYNSGDYNLSLRPRNIKDDDPLDTFDELSCADQEILDEVFSRYGHLNRWKLVKMLHDPEFCPEWEDPQGSAYSIDAKDILLKNGKSVEETQAIIDKLKEVDDLLTTTKNLS